MILWDELGGVDGMEGRRGGGVTAAPPGGPRLAVLQDVMFSDL